MDLFTYEHAVTFPRVLDEIVRGGNRMLFNMKRLAKN